MCTHVWIHAYSIERASRLPRRRLKTHLELNNGIGSHAVERDQDSELLGGAGIAQRVGKHQSTWTFVRDHCGEDWPETETYQEDRRRSTEAVSRNRELACYPSRQGERRGETNRSISMLAPARISHGCCVGEVDHEAWNRGVWQDDNRLTRRDGRTDEGRGLRRRESRRGSRKQLLGQDGNTGRNKGKTQLGGN